MPSDSSEWLLAVGLLAVLALVLSPIFTDLAAAFRFIEFLDKGLR